VKEVVAYFKVKVVETR